MSYKITTPYLYQEMLRSHSYLYQRRSKDVAVAASALGLVEVHSSVPAPPATARFVSNFNETPAKQAIIRDEQLARDGMGLTPRPEAFPNTGYLGQGVV